METGATGRAGAKARSIEEIERALEEDVDSPTKEEIEDILGDITGSRDWTEVFLGVAS